MTLHLKALGLRNYRGIGPAWQLMSPFQEFNFFIGANNTGKSTILNFISKWLPLRTGGSRSNGPQLGPAEIYLHGLTGQPEMAFGLPASELIEAVIAARRDSNFPVDRVHLTKIIDALTNDGVVWVKNSIPSGNPDELILPNNGINFEDLLTEREWRTLWNILSGRSGGGLTQHWIPEVLDYIKNAVSVALPQPILIPAIREIGPKGQKFEEFGGRGLIDRLAEMQSPDIDKRDERKIFDKINAFLQTVTGHDNAQIEIPHNREHILVHIDGKVLPLWALGTGIQEVIMIASYCTITQGTIACIEEPELHLHPLLQRKLLNYLRENTENQYFIATHSAAFIDTPGAGIFHVQLDDGQTKISESILRTSRYAICQDLGYKASDIVQSNSVIWCEGPSDRIYLNHWIAALDADLREGIHYSIMFYGGRNLSHLTADDDEVGAFISLKALNRNSAVLIDSDRDREGDQLNATKLRICKEFEKDNGVAWVTQGREIENYISFPALGEAIANAHPKSFGCVASTGDSFSHALYFRRTNAPETEAPVIADKVKVARAVCTLPADLDILDLRERLIALVAMIRTANS